MLKKFIGSIVTQLTTQNQQERDAQLYRNLLRHEAKLGGTVFGAVPEGRRREFFCLDEHTWVWHEEWIDEKGQQQILMTRYDIRPDCILKSQNGNHYQPVNKAEAARLWQAAQAYYKKVKQEIYTFA